MRSRIFAHRGLWGAHEQNSLKAISDAVNHGFGVETDMRLYKSKVVLSHDPVFSSNTSELNSILPSQAPLALNIKMDGLMPYLDRSLLNESNCFFFDGSLPELYKYRTAGLDTACRVSEFESGLPWLSKVIWVDSFQSEWWIGGKLIDELSEKSLVVIVSPELHGRNHLLAWEKISEYFSSGNPNIAICTDFPFEFEKQLQ